MELKMIQTLKFWKGPGGVLARNDKLFLDSLQASTIATTVAYRKRREKTRVTINKYPKIINSQQ